MSDPRNGWTFVQALALVGEGYTVAHVEELTGWHAKQLTAQLRAVVVWVWRSAAGPTGGRWRQLGKIT